MQRSVRSESEFRQYCKEFPSTPLKCNNCSMQLSRDCVHTPEGWAVAIATGVCEDCMDDLVTHASGDES